MKEERKFLRQCIVCRQYKEKNDLIRLTRDFLTGETKINSDNSIHGRSVYICKNEECIEKVLQKKKFLQALKAKNTENIKEILHTVLKK